MAASDLGRGRARRVYGRHLIDHALGQLMPAGQDGGCSLPDGALLTDLAGGRADGSWQQRLGRYLSPDLLMLDDFAMREYTLAQAEDLYELVGKRYRRGSLILTTNREPKDFYALFPNPVIAEGLLDRLMNSAYVITMLGQSYRPRLSPDQRKGGVRVAN